ncbi:DUF2061 domain-containing protein [[Muricauda] lutisoli]|uniref:DUF2061 domain-containing protein n=1 Tax=[Muricauda] lutisoli TaxID=2816035 RepID=A0ABS3EXN2_9FLAO|nr:DUF2061 domain-containing protein [[Muricauda] lutisoli]MBO0330924.1 DUF2061 domain-containing protein [[Muricauda] lutisoli]
MTKKVSYKRHLAKTITWRLVGTLDTILLSWAITGNPFTGLKIGLAEVVTKMLLYYFHERIWLNAGIDDSRKRHIIKTLTWRALGTLDTITLSWIISGDPFTGLKIGFAEVITKMMLYYFHERTWYKINYGLDKRNRAKKWRRTS